MNSDSPTLPPWVVVIAGLAWAVGSLVVGHSRQYAEDIARSNGRHRWRWGPTDPERVLRANRLVSYVSAAMGALIVVIGVAGLVNR